MLLLNVEGKGEGGRDEDWHSVCVHIANVMDADNSTLQFSIGGSDNMLRK